MKYGIFSANEWMYPDGDPTKGKSSIRVISARGGVAAAQILCESKRVTWKWTGGEGQGLCEPQVNRLISIYVDRNTAPVDTTMVIPQGTVVDYVTRLAPFDVFDAMEPMEAGTAEAAEGQMLGLYLRWPIGDMAAGVYRGTLTLTGDDGQAAEIAVEITVANVRIPEKKTLKVTNWYNVLNMATYHGVEPWSDAHWALIEQYGKRMCELHQTHFWISPSLAQVKQKENGAYSFDFSRTERLIRLYLSLGMEYIESAPLFTRGGWSNAEFKVIIDRQSVPLSSDKGMTYAEAFHTQWYAFLVKNGWYDINLQHVCDEPSAHCAENYREAASLVRKWMPHVKIMEATELPDLDGSLDVWVPKSLDYSKRSEIYEAKRGSTAKELWYYTCCFPGGKFLNRMLDMELIRTRYLHWANLLYDLEGYLHWGLNMYQHSPGGVWTGACHPQKGHGGIAPVEASAQDNINNDTLPAGDTHILYPMGQKLLTSVRFEMMRAGCEDYELLALLKKKDAKAAEEILSSCVRSFTDYTVELDVFDKAYAQLLKALE